MMRNPSLPQALSELNEPNLLSVHERPEQWLEANRKYLDDRFGRGLSRRNVSAQRISNSTHPRITIYAYYILDDEDARSSLSNALDAGSFWPEYGPIPHLSTYCITRSALEQVLRKHQHDQAIVRRWVKIQHLDNLSILARTIIALRNEDLVKGFAEKSVGGANTFPLGHFLNLLQELLDLECAGAARPLILKSLSRLANKHAVYPPSLTLSNVTRPTDDIPSAMGNFGVVWEGEHQGNKVAVKMVRNMRMKTAGKEAKAFIHEAIIWRQFLHANVLPFRGIHFVPRGDTDIVCLVSPWMENGNIADYLQRRPEVDRFSLVMDVSYGIKYLHGLDPTVVHGDLKPTNILIRPDGHACVTDFGLSSFVEDDLSRITPTGDSVLRGSLEFMAPELLNQRPDDTVANPRMRRKTLATDIYALGSVYFEIFTGRSRFASMSHYGFVDAASKNTPIDRPKEICVALWDIVTSCWRVLPATRPSITKIVQILESPPLNGSHDPQIENPTCSSLLDCSLLLSSESDSGSIISAPASATSSRLDVSTVRPGTPSSEFTFVSVETNPDTQSSMTNSLTSPQSLYPPPFPLAFTRIAIDGGQQAQLQHEDIIIAIIGVSGVGKSSFVNSALGATVTKVGNDLDSCTAEVQAFRYNHPSGDGRNIVLVDTPGFDDTNILDIDILNSIATWLSKTYRQRIRVTGIIFLHRITDARMRHGSVRCLQTFQDLVGKDALSNVILATTFWDYLAAVDDVETGHLRQAELEVAFWKPMIDHGSRTIQLQGNPQQAAWDLIDLFKQDPIDLQIQQELVTQRRSLPDTKAYRTLSKLWSDFIQTLKHVGRKDPMRRRAERQIDGFRSWRGRFHRWNRG